MENFRKPRFGDYLTVCLSDEAAMRRGSDIMKCKVIDFKKIIQGSVCDGASFDPDEDPKEISFVGNENQAPECVVVVDEASYRVFTITYDSDYQFIERTDLLGTMMETDNDINELIKGMPIETILKKTLSMLNEAEKEIIDHYTALKKKTFARFDFSDLVGGLYLLQRISCQKYDRTGYGDSLEYFSKDLITAPGSCYKNFLGYLMNNLSNEKCQNTAHNLWRDLNDFLKESCPDISLGIQPEKHYEAGETKPEFGVSIVKRNEGCSFCEQFALIRSFNIDTISIGTSGYRTHGFIEQNPEYDDAVFKTSRVFDLQKGKNGSYVLDEILDCLKEYKEYYLKLKEYNKKQHY